MELNATIDRMNGNENFSAGAVSAIYAFVLSNTIGPISGLLAALALLVVGFGLVRYAELRRHALALDAYLRAAEREITPEGGWSAHFDHAIAPRPRISFSTTRWTFWLGLSAAAVVGAIFVGGRLI